jgi:hypothetical protein
MDDADLPWSGNVAIYRRERMDGNDPRRQSTLGAFRNNFLDAGVKWPVRKVDPCSAFNRAQIMIAGDDGGFADLRDEVSGMEWPVAIDQQSGQPGLYQWGVQA